jgi:hypothetical protein
MVSLRVEGMIYVVWGWRCGGNDGFHDVMIMMDDVLYRDIGELYDQSFPSLLPRDVFGGRLVRLS